MGWQRGNKIGERALAASVHDEMLGKMGARSLLEGQYRGAAGPGRVYNADRGGSAAGGACAMASRHGQSFESNARSRAIVMRDDIHVAPLHKHVAGACLPRPRAGALRGRAAHTAGGRLTAAGWASPRAACSRYACMHAGAPCKVLTQQARALWGMPSSPAAPPGAAAAAVAAGRHAHESRPAAPAALLRRSSAAPGTAAPLPP